MAYLILLVDIQNHDLFNWSCICYQYIRAGRYIFNVTYNTVKRFEQVLKSSNRDMKDQLASVKKDKIRPKSSLICTDRLGVPGTCQKGPVAAQSETF